MRQATFGSGEFIPERELELVREVWEAIQAKKLDQLDDLVDAAYEWDCVAERPGIQVVRGREAVKAFIETWPKGWDEYRLWSEHLIECDHHILQFVHLRARREDPPGRLDQPAALLHTLTEGRLLRTEVYFHRGDALEAVGLPEAGGGGDGKKPSSSL